MDNQATAQALQKPGIGRIVHLVRGTEHIAAIITAVGPEVLEVTAFVPSGETLTTSVDRLNYGDEPGQWHWPERV